MTIVAAAKAHKVFAPRDLVVGADHGDARYGQRQYRYKLNNPSHLVAS
jgi:hypothetical protein